MVINCFPIHQQRDGENMRVKYMLYNGAENKKQE